jgi:hypothetical protein
MSITINTRYGIQSHQTWCQTDLFTQIFGSFKAVKLWYAQQQVEHSTARF